MTDGVLYNIWNEYYPKVYGYFFKRVDNKNDVDDLTSLVMEKYLNLFQDSEKANQVTNKHAYLWKIANNQLADFIKNKQKRIVTIGLNDELFSLEVELEKNYSSRYLDKFSCLIDCMRESLKDQDLRIVQMSFLEEFNSKEIGQILNLTSENVRKKLSRSISKLKTSCRDIWATCQH
jgi:RNA polymerase sigma factor (sigma-70 family)